MVVRGGSTTFRAGTMPLYIVDGFEVASNERGRILINPHDIERIQVLKNADETAFYGFRGANGVVLITTRRGG